MENSVGYFSGGKIGLARQATSTRKRYDSKSSYRDDLESKAAAIGELQRRLAAARRESVLFVFEGLDAAGKDGTVRRVFSACDPQSCRFTSIEEPTALERRYDFLWRFGPALPRHGELAVLNRSWYGDVVIPRVHPELLSEGYVPGGTGANMWAGRFWSILDREAHLARNGTRIVKIFLHISADEQRRRLLKRIERSSKSWKADIEDVCDHRRFASYLRHYEKCIARTHSGAAPWFIVPADDKPNARLMVADIVLQALRAIHPGYPAVSKERARQLEEMRAILLGKTSAEQPAMCIDANADRGGTTR